MPICAVLIRGDFTFDEFNRVVALIRALDTKPGRKLEITAVDPDVPTVEAAKRLVEALPPLAGRESSPIATKNPETLLSEKQLAVLSADICAGCLRHALVGGPRAGMNQNVACMHCGAEFNLATMGGVPVWGERLSPPGKPDTARLWQIYKIALPKRPNA